MSIMVIIAALSFVYLLLAYVCLGKLNRSPEQPSAPSSFQPPVTIFKPVCGLDSETEENLRSFCEQDYPKFQIIFGLRDPNDPAIPVIEKIIAEYPGLDITHIVDQQLHGSNYKVSNLINMYGHAKHDVLLIADDDMRVTKDYLNAVVPPLDDREVGVVTCLYSGSPRGGIASSLNAMFINEWFLPSVLISETFNKTGYCFGATMVIPREILESIGGFQSLVNYLADDYMLGRLVTEQGYRIYLSRYVVKNIVEERNFSSMLSHELRWARTLRTVEPLGYAFTFLTDTLVMNCVAAVAVYAYTQQLLWPVLILGLASSMRILYHQRVKHKLGAGEAGSIWLIPIRDILSFSIRVLSFAGNKIQWKQDRFSVDNTGLIHSGQISDY